MSSLRVPVITAVIGEGGSGGALAIGVCDRLIMLQYSIYSVISPEGCASILWKSADKKEIAAEAMGITADRLDKLGLVDESAARAARRRAPRSAGHGGFAQGRRCVRHLDEVAQLPEDTLLAQRYERLRGQGVYRAAN